MQRIKYEIKIATGATQEQLEERVNFLASVRGIEIREELKKGHDVIDFPEFYFKISGPIVFADGQWSVPMSRGI